MPTSTTPITRPCAGGRLVLAGLATAALALAGCGQSGSSSTAVDSTAVDSTGTDPSEPAVADAGPCPTKLPIGEDPSGHGFGSDEVAEQAPSLPEPQEAWVCQYVPVEAETTGQGGTVFEWKREGKPQPVAAQKLARLQRALADLAPADRKRACTADLGPRWLVVTGDGDDRTGIVVDDYGCHDVRLTDDPHETAPGEDDQDGVVGGVLQGGSAILDAVGVGRAD